MPAKPQRSPKGRNGTKPCPICGKPSSEANRPFCSDRCQDVDLNRWLSGTYSIPGRTEEDDKD